MGTGNILTNCDNVKVGRVFHSDESCSTVESNFI